MPGSFRRCRRPSAASSDWRRRAQRPTGPDACSPATDPGGSGDFLMGALPPRRLREHPDMPACQTMDWLLTDAFITAAVRCAAATTSPTPEDICNCRPHLEAEIRGAAARPARSWRSARSPSMPTSRLLRSRGIDVRPRPVVRPRIRSTSLPNGVTLIGCYHQAVRTRTRDGLTADMMDRRCVLPRGASIASLAFQCGKVRSPADGIAPRAVATRAHGLCAPAVDGAKRTSLASRPMLFAAICSAIPCHGHDASGRSVIKRIDAPLQQPARGRLIVTVQTWTARPSSARASSTKRGEDDAGRARTAPEPDSRRTRTRDTGQRIQRSIERPPHFFSRAALVAICGAMRRARSRSTRSRTSPGRRARRLAFCASDVDHCARASATRC